MIESSKKPPFIMVKNEDCPIRDFETPIKDRVKLPKNIMISKAVKITYFPNQTVSTLYDYEGPSFEFNLAENQIDDDHPLEMHDMLNAPSAIPPGIKSAKHKDVVGLLDFLSPESKH